MTLFSQNYSKWIWSIVVLYMGSFWGSVISVTARNPPSPSTVEAQAKFFQDFFTVQLSPYKIEFGHVCEDPNTWEQRYEAKDYKNHRDMGKVRWGDKHGGYGEHYWDLNHAGNAENHGNDDQDYERDTYNGPYSHDEENINENYDEPKDQSSNYASQYDADSPGQYDESSRSKRAFPKVKSEKKVERIEESYEETEPARSKERSKKHYIKNKEPQADFSHTVEEVTETPEEIEVTRRPKKKRVQYRPSDQIDEENFQSQKTQVEELAAPYKSASVTEKSHIVPYENGAGIRQHYHPELAAAASATRLFLEPSTGHVIDRSTGQAYVLQPVHPRQTL